MLISVLFAWVAALCALLTTVKFLTKRNKKINKIFRRIHIPCGIIMLIAGLVHGLVAGNSPRSTLGEAMVAPLLFSFNMGTICFVLSGLLAFTYLLRKKLKKQWMHMHRILTLLLAAALVIHLYQTGISLPSFFSVSSNEIVVSSNVGTAVSSSADASVTAASSPEASSDYSSDLSLPSEPLTESNDVTTDHAEQAQPSNSITFSGAVLKDGTYEGSADGFRSTINLSVNVSDGAVTAIQVLQQNDTPQFWQRAFALINTIVKEQSLEVDAISAATFSSKGILNAVYQALQNAVMEGELKITQITTNTNSHGGPGRH